MPNVFIVNTFANASHPFVNPLFITANPGPLINRFLDWDHLRRPRLYSYIVATDTGFAPCVTKNLLTLACCKPKIRNTAKPGDWVMGTTPKKKGPGRLVFLAQITDNLTFAGYYTRVSKKRRDNIQLNTRDYGPDQKNKNVSVDAVLLADDFVYYGGSAIPTADRVHDLIAITRGHKKSSDSECVYSVLDWARKVRWGVRGQPTDTSEC